MSERPRARFDLDAPAPNGLRRGRTTGTCATAAVKAALLHLLRGDTPAEVEVTLPDGEHYLVVPVERVERLPDGSARAEVRKDGGDDPDNTHGAILFAVVRPGPAGEIRFLAGEGVGTVTQPGIRVPVGEPAINPVPREMMRTAVAEVLRETGREDARGWELEIGCVNGEEIARRTFNPRLGILGGISILGTTGIVEPMSMEAYMASIEVYIRVALGDHPEEVAYTPGKIGRAFAQRELRLVPKRIVQISNFVGFALDRTEEVLRDEGARLGTLWVMGHPGKLAKVLDGVWDTHSRGSGMAMGGVARVAEEAGWEWTRVREIEACNTVEGVIEHLGSGPAARTLWTEVEERVAGRMRERVPRVERVEVRLFAMSGTALGRAA
ncbi:MAG: cobalt-precorrin-5B (C(1))-methyltransferase CbiD [Gemmatimonadota bacterium]|nr:cobalt-precorrin-5B (C(1))-methyltransferase CbiD [Gemmatimonadota bacterium]